MEEKHAHIQLAINFANLVRSTLGPRGMNKIVVKGQTAVHTNDGATIIQTIDAEDPVINLFKELAKSQEEAIGDGTTTAIVLAGQLLNNGLTLINKGIHPTTIINGYNIARAESIRHLNNLKEKGDKEKIIQTAFGSKIPSDIVHHLMKILLKIKDYEEIKIHKINNSDPLKSKLFNGFVFDGFTITDQMDPEIEGNIAILDYRTHVEASDIQVNSAEEAKKLNEYDRKYKKGIVDKLIEKNVKCLFYTDTNPEFESYLLEKGITGVVLFERDKLSLLCQNLNLLATSDINNIFVKKGKVKYVKPNQIYVDGNVETLVLHGPTTQTLDEIERSVHDVISILKHNTEIVIGAGAIELVLAKHLIDLANKVGGKEQLAIEKFAEALESIPLIIAENAGLDAIQILTALKTQHQTNPDFGVDIVAGISDARKRGVIDPALVKIHALNSATNVTNLILKTDQVLLGEKKK